MPSRGRLRARASWIASAAILAIALATAACGARRFVLPDGPGEPLADAVAEWSRASATCGGVRSFTAELRLSGRAAGTRLRGTIQAGFETPGRIRLEGLAPFGRPVFILAGDAVRATLLLPRDERVVQGAAASEILDALAGVRLGADALRAVLTGCVLDAATPISATQHGDIARFVFDAGEVYARRVDAGWRIVAGSVRPFRIEYVEQTGLWPRRVRISRDLPGGEGVDVVLGVAQIQTNVALPPEAFRVDVPPGTLPMSVEQLRRAGPLGDDK